MTSSSVYAAAAESRQFTFTRDFDAPCDQVWKMWTDAEHFARWWGPRGCKVDVIKADIRPGGVFHYTMRFSNAPDMWGLIAYEALMAPSRIVFVNAFSNPEGELTRAPFEQAFPLRIRYAVTFDEQGGKTRLMLTGRPLDATAAESEVHAGMFGSMEKGFGATFDALARHLKSNPVAVAK